MDFTVEITTEPPTGGDWTVLRSVTDIVPGTLLIEDPEEPVLVMPVEAADPMKAASFADGIATVVGFTIVAGTIAPAPPVDFDLAEDGAEDGESNEVVAKVHDWVTAQTPIRGHVSQGRFVDA